MVALLRSLRFGKRVVFLLGTLLCMLFLRELVLSRNPPDPALSFAPISFARHLGESSRSMLGEQRRRRLVPMPVRQTAHFCAKYETNYSWPLNFSRVPTDLGRHLSGWPADASHLSGEEECPGVPPRPLLPCDADCEGMRALLQQWPSDKPRAVIYFLVQLKRLNTFEENLRRIDAFFNDKHRYPIVLFHDDNDNYVDRIKLQVRSWTKSVVFFQTVHFELPAHIAHRQVSESYCGKSIGYRHMCRFQAQEVYHQPILAGLDYTLRLDDDSEILRPIDYDVFRVLRNKRCRYGHILATVDTDACVAGLWEATCKYVREQGVTAQFFDHWPHKKMYYNNFEVSELALWRSCAYRHFMDYIDRLGGIYYYRWGDAPIRSLAVALFVPEHQVHNYGDIGYRHDYISIL